MSPKLPDPRPKPPREPAGESPRKAALVEPLGKTLRSHRIVDLPLLRIAQDLVGLVDQLELGFGRLVSRISVGMVLHGQLPVGLLDLVGRGPSADAQNAIVVLG